MAEKIVGAGSVSQLVLLCGWHSLSGMCGRI